MFERLNLINKFNIDVIKLKEFVLQVSKSYRRVPFHNFTHCFNVTHVLYCILRQNEHNGENQFAKYVFQDLDKLAMLLACIGHDLNHPGLGNTYFVKADHRLSATVNGKSVLENYHCYSLLRLMEVTDVCGFLDYK